MRELIDSFQKEVTVIGNINGEDSKMEVLEKAISGYKIRMSQIEADPSLYTPTDNNKRWIEEKNSLLREREEFINKYKELEDKCADLKDQIDHRALKGDFNLRETKVLHYKCVINNFTLLTLIKLIGNVFLLFIKNESSIRRI